MLVLTFGANIYGGMATLDRKLLLNINYYGKIAVTVNYFKQVLNFICHVNACIWKYYTY